MVDPPPLPPLWWSLLLFLLCGGPSSSSSSVHRFAGRLSQKRVVMRRRLLPPPLWPYIPLLPLLLLICRVSTPSTAPLPSWGRSGSTSLPFPLFYYPELYFMNGGYKAFSTIYPFNCCHKSYFLQWVCLLCGGPSSSTAPLPSWGRSGSTSLPFPLFYYPELYFMNGGYKAFSTICLPCLGAHSTDSSHRRR